MTLLLAGIALAILMVFITRQLTNSLLSDFDAEQLFYTIPDFHNTRKRYEKLKADMASDPCGRVSEVRDELDWLLSMEDEACRLTDLFNAGKLPLRVTHNDTKINNVLFDE